MRSKVPGKDCPWRVVFHLWENQRAMPTSSPLLSVVIVNYNAGLPLLCLLDDLALGKDKIEVIVVDNTSSDGTPRDIACRHPWVDLIRNSENRGFAAAVNEGSRRAAARWLFILNPDCRASVRDILRLVALAEEESHVRGREVVVGPRVLNTDGTIQESARSYPGLLTALFNRKSLLTKAFPSNRWSTRYLRPPGREVDWVSGAALLLKRDLFLAHGGFSEDYFMYCEDVDLCRRLKEKGVAILHMPEVSITHAIGGCSAGARFKVIHYHHDAMWVYARRWNKGIVPLPAVWLGIQCRRVLKLAAEALRRMKTVPDRAKSGLREAITARLARRRPGAPPRPRRILCIRADHLGDVLLTVPAVAALARHYPDAEVHFMARGHWHPLLARCVAITKLLPWTPSWRQRLGLMVKGRYDLVLDFGQRATLTDAILAAVARIPRRVGYHTSYTGLFLTDAKRWDGRYRAEVEMTSRLLRLIAVPTGDVAGITLSQLLSVRSWGGGRGRGAPLGLPPVALHPFAVSSFGLKEWPLPRFVELARGLASAGVRVIVLGAASDAEKASVFAAISGVTVMAGKTPLAELPELLTGCALLIANNSGIYQLADGLGVPVILINGPSNLVRWGPRSKLTRVLEEARFSCRGRDCGACVRGDHGCMAELSVSRVQDAAFMLLGLTTNAFDTIQKA